jgi:chromosome segregation ATPase
MRRLLFVLALLLIPPGVSAQGLGDAAARERQKREKESAKKPTHAYTNADLRQEEPPKKGEKQEARSGESEAARIDRERSERQSHSEEPDQGARPDPAAERVAQAQSEVESARGRVSEIEARVSDLRGRLNPQSTTYIYGAYGSNSANDELQVRAELNDAENELAAARQALGAAEEALQDARQGRVPR